MARKTFAVVFGVLGLLVGAALVAGAISLLAADRDDAGFYNTNEHRFERSSHAIVSDDLDILSDAPGWVVDMVADPVDLRITRSGGDQGHFVGVGRTTDVDRYLDGVAHDEVTDIDLDGRSISNVDYEPHDGPTTPTPPGAENFWEASTEGSGPQTLDWDLEAGNWTVVVMNADGSPGVDVDLAFGAKISNIIAIGWGVLAFGVFSLLGGGYLLYRGVRPATARERTDQSSPPPIDVLDLRDSPAVDDERMTEEPALDQHSTAQT